MPNFIVYRLLSDKGEISPHPVGYGNTEIKPYSLLFSKEKLVIVESIKSFNENVNLDIVPSISIIVEADNPEEADYLAEIKFEQVLDCKNAGLAISESRILNSGYIKNLDTEKIYARLNTNSFIRYPSFKIMDRLIPKLENAQYILTIEESELNTALQRSYHWLRRSENENDLHLKCLFSWFSIECLAKVGEENIVGKIMQVLGFPIGKMGKFVPKEKINALKNHEDYEALCKKTDRQLNEMRELRNKTVHEGFRSWDISFDLFKDFHNILTIVVPKIQYYAFRGLQNNLQTVKELWGIFPLLFEETINVVGFHLNTLYMLKNRDTTYFYHKAYFKEYGV